MNTNTTNYIVTWRTDEGKEYSKCYDKEITKFILDAIEYFKGYKLISIVPA